MKTIEIVTHCYSGESVPIYHRLLQAQLGSLIRSAPDRKVKVIVSICLTKSDVDTKEVLDWFHIQTKDLPNLEIRPWFFEPSHLFRRAIGRNVVALCSAADVVWFTDCDYFFLGESLDQAVEQCLAAETNIVHPEYVNIHKSHAWGDALIEKMNELPTHPPQFNLQHYVPRRESRAIGGIQIVKGMYCREFGYLRGSKWIEAVDAGAGFRSCKCDVPFRKRAGGSTAVEIGGVFRIRHSRTGRDHGKKDHGASTRI